MAAEQKHALVVMTAEVTAFYCDSSSFLKTNNNNNNKASIYVFETTKCDYFGPTSNNRQTRVAGTKRHEWQTALLGKASNALQNTLPGWLYSLVYCLHYTPNPVFFHQVARCTTWSQRRKKRCHVCILNWRRCTSLYGFQLATWGRSHHIPCPWCFWQYIFIERDDHFVTVAHSESKILLQVVFLTPCVHDHVTTPTRGWWKITSLQATGKWMLLCSL